MKRKKHKFQFIEDENFPQATGKFLKSKGHTVKRFPQELRNKKVPDENIIKIAIKKGAILLFSYQKNVGRTDV